MFKRQARIGGVSFDDAGAGVDVDELVELFVLLIAMTEFLDVSFHRCDWRMIEAHTMISMKSNEILRGHERWAYLHSLYGRSEHNRSGRSSDDGRPQPRGVPQRNTCH